MSRTTRRSFRGYSYEEADTFAAYLSEMAAQGWYLKKLGIGMLFKKGEPSETVYDVQVFPKGKDGDWRPDRDAMEMADYCENAGWKLIDGRGKFVVFRQISPDAVPIVTQEEKYENIRRAALHYLRAQMLYSLFGLLIFLFIDVYLDPTTALFCNPYLLSTLFLAFCSCDTAVQLFSLTRRFQSWRSELDAGMTPFYGALKKDGHTGFQTDNMVRNIAGLLFLFLLVVSIQSEYSGHYLIVGIVVVTVISLIFNLILGMIKPDRYTYGMIGICLILFCLVFVTIAVDIGNSILSESYSAEDLVGDDAPEVVEALPLSASDYLTNPQLSLCYEDITDSSSVLGHHVYANLQYDEYHLSLYYDIMTCRYDWTADLIWDYEIREAEEKVSDPYNQDWNEVEKDNYQSTDLSENLDEAERNALWNADETVVYWNEWYVRKGNTVIRIEFSTLPDAEQIQKIAAKLGL